MIKEITITKNIALQPEDLHNNTINDKIASCIKQRYENRMVEGVFILKILNIQDVSPLKIVEHECQANVSFSCTIYKLNEGELIDVIIINSTNIGTYAFDPLVGKDISLFFIPGSIEQKEGKIKIYITGIRTERFFTCVASIKI